MTDYMTNEEMLRRLKAGENPVSLSLEKWKRAIPPRGKAVLEPLSVWFWIWCCCRNCALCAVNKNTYGYVVCRKCPLQERGRLDGECCKPWKAAKDAAVRQDRPGFMRARAALIKRLQRLL